MFSFGNQSIKRKGSLYVSETVFHASWAVCLLNAFSAQGHLTNLSQSCIPAQCVFPFSAHVSPHSSYCGWLTFQKEGLISTVTFQMLIFLRVMFLFNSPEFSSPAIWFHLFTSSSHCIYQRSRFPFIMFFPSNAGWLADCGCPEVLSLIRSSHT